MSLDRAEAKLDHLPQARPAAGRQFLDIGCGWGGLLLYAAERYGARAVGVTLSDDQHAYVSNLIAERGLSGRVEVRRMDYRDVPELGSYDKIASVGMFDTWATQTCRLFRQGHGY
jgi:cyclopropane-fatty-acyl-phospholipid synthase